MNRTFHSIPQKHPHTYVVIAQDECRTLKVSYIKAMSRNRTNLDVEYLEFGNGHRVIESNYQNVWWKQIYIFVIKLILRFKKQQLHAGHLKLK